MITLSKLAKLAHVSVSTVSKAFSMSNEVNEQTRELIFKLAREHGCFKKYYNAKYPKFVVAVICPEFRGRYYSHYMAIIQEQLAKHNIELCVATTDFSPENERNLLEYYNNYSSVDAIININGQVDSLGFDVPIISINPAKNVTQCVLETNAYNAFRSVIEHFYNHKITDIGFIGELRTMSKLNQFKEIMTEVTGNFNERFLITTDKRFEEGGYDAMSRLIESGNIPRAVICAYDYMAIGSIRCALDKGLKIPEDIAVVGMNNIPECEYLNPTLATIASDTNQLCINAVEMVVSILEGTEYKLTDQPESKFILRKSAEI